MLVHEFLELSSRRHAAKTAVIHRAHRITYARLNSLADNLAAQLRVFRLLRGDRIAIYVEDPLIAVIAVFACLKVNAIYVLVDPRSRSRRLHDLLTDCDPQVVVVNGSCAMRLDRAGFMGVSSVALCSVALSGTSLDCELVYESDRDTLPTGRENNEDSRKSATCIPVDIASITYTSGSHGAQKGVAMTHANVANITESIIAYLNLSIDDVIMNALPLSFDYGFYQVLMALRCGATIVLEDDFMAPGHVLAVMARERVSIWPATPTIFAMLKRMSLPSFPLPDLRCITTTGSRVTRAMARWVADTFPNVEIFSMYGLTECKRVSYLPPDEFLARPDSVGVPIPNTEAFIVDGDGAPLPPGEIGELVVRGAHIMSGYWRKPAESAQAVRPGLFIGDRVLYTGDLFRADVDGFLYFVGRKDDVVKIRDRKVSLVEVEDVVAELPQVVEVAAVALPHELLGNTLKVFIISNCEMNADDIIAHCRSRLDRHSVPVDIEFRVSFPRTMSGKVDKLSLSTI